jgi:hypothetical protein
MSPFPSNGPRHGWSKWAGRNGAGENERIHLSTPRIGTTNSSMFAGNGPFAFGLYNILVHEWGWPALLESCRNQCQGPRYFLLVPNNISAIELSQNER